MATKLILTNPSALLSRYGEAGVAQIESAIDRCIAADAVRGIATERIAVPPNASTAADFKRALDSACAGRAIEYVLILGGPQIVPYCELVNPIHDENGDVDLFAPGDLPYACEKPFSRTITDFVGPTRVVGRLPDLAGATEPSYLISLLSAAAQHQPNAASPGYFGLTADVWKQSTQTSLARIFGSVERLAIAPPNGPDFATDVLQPSFHFVNCHGAPADPNFYGQQGQNFPVALSSAHLDGVSTGTVAAFECCYGGELYDPSLAAGAMSIAQRYLALGSAGVIASSTIAYGPAVGNAQADLLCVYFMQSVLAGASLGRAFLEARQKYIRSCRVLTPIDLKTIAQFVLLGDPALVPMGQRLKALPMNQSTRRKRRIYLRELGITLPSSVAVTQRLARPAVPPRVEALIKSELRKMLPRGGRDLSRSSYLVRQSADTAVKSLVLPTKVHVTLTPTGERSLAGLIAVEHRDTVELQRVYSR